MSRTVAILLAGGRGQRLSILTRYRAKPAVPFGGKYRIIDFTLSNCVHSGIDEVYILTQYISHSLIRHLGSGKAWDLDRKKGGLHVLHPHLGVKGAGWYRGTADALYQNLNTLQNIDCDQFLILSGDHVYMMNYNEFVCSFKKSGKPSAVAVIEIPARFTRNFGIATLNRKGDIVYFEEKPARSSSNLASMGIYIFKKEFLFDILEKLEKVYDNLDFGKHVIPFLVQQEKISAYVFNGFWLDIGTVKSYYEASLDLLKKRAKLSLFKYENRVLTKTDDRPPLVISRTADVSRSIVSDGCFIEGKVTNSILSPGVVVEKGATVENSVVFHDCMISRGAVVRDSILDKEVRVGAGAVIGVGDKSVKNRYQPEYINFGTTLVGKRTRIWSNMRVGCNCIVSGSPFTGYIPRRNIEDGESLIIDPEVFNR